MENKSKIKTGKKRRIAFFSTILIVCTVCVGITISMQMNSYYENKLESKENIDNTELYEIDQELFRSKFINSFNNKLGTQNIAETDITKIDNTKEIVYTNKIQENIEGKYEININIPYINVDSEIINKYNQEINNIFESKIEDVKKSNVKTIYTVDYMANITNNVLSIVIKSTLKEGENSQRLILKTYNYNLIKNKQINLEEIIDNKNLNKKDIKEKVKIEIEKQNSEALELQKLGYSIFVRNITEDMFNIENMNTYFTDSEGYLYIIYPYGNNNLTTEMDIVVFH